MRASPGSASAELPIEAEEYLSWLVNERGRSARTVAAYRSDLRGFSAFLAQRSGGEGAGADVLCADADDIADWLAHLRGVLRRSEATVARAAVSVRGFCRFLVSEDLASSDPSAQVDMPSSPPGLPRALRVDDVEALLASPVGDGPLVLRDRAMLEVLYGMGLRVSELVGLSLGDADLSERTMRVWGKGGKERIVPVGRMAAAALGHWLSGAGRAAVGVTAAATRDDESAMFVNARGRRLTRQGAWLIVRRHGERVGLGPDLLTPHVLRHSCATHMLDGGADIRSVQELLGHASLTSTQRYTAVSQARLTEVYRSAHPRARY